MLRRKRGTVDSSSDEDNSSSGDEAPGYGRPRRRAGCCSQGNCILATFAVAGLVLLGTFVVWGVAKIGHQWERVRLDSPAARTAAAAALRSEIDAITYAGPTAAGRAQSATPGAQDADATRSPPACAAAALYGGKRNTVALAAAEAAALREALGALDRSRQASGATTGRGTAALGGPTAAKPIGGGSSSAGDAVDGSSGAPALPHEEGSWLLCTAVALRPNDPPVAILPVMGALDARSHGGREAIIWASGNGSGAAVAPATALVAPSAGGAGGDGSPSAPGAASSAPDLHSLPKGWEPRPWLTPTLAAVQGWMSQEAAFVEAVEPALQGSPWSPSQGSPALRPSDRLAELVKAARKRLQGEPRAEVGPLAEPGRTSPRSAGKGPQEGWAAAAAAAATVGGGGGPLLTAWRQLEEAEQLWADRLWAAGSSPLLGQPGDPDEAAAGGDAGRQGPRPGSAADVGVLAWAASTAQRVASEAASVAEQGAQEAAASLLGRASPLAVDWQVMALDFARTLPVPLPVPAAAAGARPCRVWSFGVERDWSFELAAVAAGCSVTAFDPSVDRRRAAAFGRAAGVRFLPWGLAGSDSRESRFGRLPEAVGEAMAGADAEIEAVRDAASDAALLNQGAAERSDAGAANAAAGTTDAGALAKAPAPQSAARLRRGGAVLGTGAEGDAPAPRGGRGGGAGGTRSAALTKIGALKRAREASTAGGPSGAAVWRTRSLPSLLAAPESVTGLPAGASLDVLKIDVEGSEWEALEACLDAGRGCWGRIRQLAVELHVLPRGGFKDARGGVDGEQLNRRSRLLRRLREEAGFEGVQFHVNPMGPSVSLVPASRSGVGVDMPCCGEALFVRRDALTADLLQDDDA